MVRSENAIWRRCWLIADDHISMLQERLEEPHTGPTTHLQGDRTLAGIQVEIQQAPFGMWLIMRERGRVTGDVPSGWLDFGDLRPKLRHQLAAKRSGDPLCELKDAHTGEWQIGAGHGYTSRAANEEFVKAAGTAEKVFPSLNRAPERFGTRQIQLADGIAYHLLGDRCRRLPTRVLAGAALGEEQL
jgi:hypothetical protein